jgi:prefoldin subunit 5
MNNTRRKQIDKVLASISDIRDSLRELVETVDGLMCEEQDAFDNMPEGLQGSEKGEKVEEAIYRLESSFQSIDQAVSCLDEAESDLEDAKE